MSTFREITLPPSSGWNNQGQDAVSFYLGVAQKRERVTEGVGFCIRPSIQNHNTNALSEYLLTVVDSSQYSCQASVV
jgi:hypothetical protein